MHVSSRMKKNIIFILLIPFLFFGCQKKAAYDDLFGDNVKKQKLEQVTLTIYLTAGSQGIQDLHSDVQEVFRAIEKKTKKTLNIKFDIKFMEPGHYDKKIEGVINEDEPCDLFVISTGSNLYNTILEQEMALDITELFPRYAPNYFNRLDPGTLKTVTRDGKIVAIPSNVYYTNKPVVLVREDLFQKYEMSTITNIEDINTFMDMVKKGEEKKYSLALESDQAIWETFVGYYGYTILNTYPLGLLYKTDDPKMKIIAIEKIPELVEIFEIGKNWMNRDYYLKGLSPYKRANSLNIGIFAAYITRQLAVFEINTILEEQNKGFKYLEFPLFPSVVGQRYEYQQGLMVNKKSENPERALMFLEWVHKNQKNYDLLRYGIKGKNYSLKNNQLTLPRDEESQYAYSYGDQLYPAFINWDYERIYEGSSNEYLKEVLESYKNNSAQSRNFGFHLDTTGMNISSRAANIERLNTKFVSINKSPAKMVESLVTESIQKDIDNVVLLAQEQLDNWRNGEE